MIYKHREGVPIDDFKQMLLKEYKMSIIEWQTGIPTEEGRYIITTSQNEVTTAYYSYEYRDDCYYWFDNSYHVINDVIAQCPLSEIEPYKE